MMQLPELIFVTEVAGATDVTRLFGATVAEMLPLEVSFLVLIL